MTEREIEKGKRLVQEIKYMPLSGPILDDVFCVFAIRVCTPESVGRKRLVPGKFYYLLDGFSIREDAILISKDRFNRSVHDYYPDCGKSSPNITVSAVVGENGAGKSSLIEFELRLINNFSTAVFGEFAKVNGWPHLHYINDVNGELYYLHKQNVLCLKVEDRKVSLYCFYRQEEEENGCYMYKQPKEGQMNLLPGIDGFKRNRPIRSPYFTNYFEGLKSILPRFFYTVVLNQSVYAYNTNDYWRENNTEEYEVAVRHGLKRNEKGKRIRYSTEEKSWLDGIFYKNDGYQIPLLLTPFRSEGNYDINVENRLAYERLMSIMVRQSDEARIINGHLSVEIFRFKRKFECPYDLSFIHKNLGYHQFLREDFEKMSSILLTTWSELVHYDIAANSKSVAYREQAINYLVYKTLKIASTYDEYRDFHHRFNLDKETFDEGAFRLLVQRTIVNYSHVSSKLYRTIAYLIWRVFEFNEVPYDNGTDFSVREINKKWIEAVREEKVDITSSIGSRLILESAVAPPFYRATIGLIDIKTEESVPFEYLSSGEKQQVYSISSLVYHLKNLDSVGMDGSTEERVAYDNVQLILEEVELYYHPELQRQFVRNLLDGIRQAGLNKIKNVNVCIVTHSPFVLSDIPEHNVLALKKDDSDVERISSFGANIHEMLKLSFFLENGTVGEFARWTITRIAQCLRVHRWIRKIEQPPQFFPSLQGDLDGYEFLEEFKPFLAGEEFNAEAFSLVYSADVILSQINLIGEPIVRRILLDDYKRTFPEAANEYKKMMRVLLQSQIDALS